MGGIHDRTRVISVVNAKKIHVVNEIIFMFIKQLSGKLNHIYTCIYNMIVLINDVCMVYVCFKNRNTFSTNLI